MNKPMTQSEIDSQLEIATTQAVSTAKKKALRKKLFAGLLAGVTLCGAGYYTYDALIGSRYVTTDNAYVGAETAHVTPLIGGPVKEVRVSDTASVKKGDILVVLDDTDARLALAQAEAALGQAERRVRGYFANDEGLTAQVAARRADQARAAADLIAAQSALDRARIDFSRRQALASSGSVSGEELTAAENAFRQASAALDGARAGQIQAAANREAAIGALKANAVLVMDTTVDTNPEVAAARARVEQAKVDLERTVIRAPVDGVVVQRTVHVGQRVQSGASLMSIVPIGEAYVDANFKEMQLTKVRIGQEVELTSDLYGSDVVFHGRVVGFSGGTGSAFALIPAQNATGNWIKVVQRVPVRIAIDEADLAKHPLRVGLSMEATIDTRS
ncbi:MAG: HlyD family efflux transporter periplasmic adaptor subunit [Gammaproteobacteria bacterium]